MHVFQVSGDGLPGMACLHLHNYPTLCHSRHKQADTPCLRSADSVQVCDHPFLLPDYESAGGVGWQGALAASGKLVVLDKLLHHLQAHAHKTLLLSHHPQVCLLNTPSPSSPNLTFPPAPMRLWDSCVRLV